MTRGQGALAQPVFMFYNRWDHTGVVSRGLALAEARPGVCRPGLPQKGGHREEPCPARRVEPEESASPEQGWHTCREVPATATWFYTVQGVCVCVFTRLK